MGYTRLKSWRDKNREKAQLIQKRYREKKKVKAAGGRERPSKCDVCEKSDVGIVWDHCHASGKFRGWICDRCNKALGMVKDSPEILIRLSKYLENFYGNVGCSET